MNGIGVPVTGKSFSELFGTAGGDPTLLKMLMQSVAPDHQKIANRYPIKGRMYAPARIQVQGRPPA